ncbi:hypothetical protein MA16_Dca022842 [Dendrobium catenatum]|uniref:AB hydrolase-1 domain-containing protein n=1 Tax=Dendrobium catenatum TaxID=906689 RepID=A0A2I0X089_9ASPA|nr:hypothetical protein MA16_Dca022842 [Dendrobium catenatum]
MRRPRAPATFPLFNFHLVGDLVALIGLSRQEQVFVVGHDWGAIVAWNYAFSGPDRLKRCVNLSVPFLPRKQVCGEQTP